MPRIVSFSLDNPSFQRQLSEFKVSRATLHALIVRCLANASGMQWDKFERDFKWRTHDAKHFSEPAIWGDFALPGMPEPVEIYAALPDGEDSGLVAPITFWKPTS